MTTYYHPLRAFGLAMACVAWAWAIELQESNVRRALARNTDHLHPIVNHREQDEIRREFSRYMFHRGSLTNQFARWVSWALVPDGWRVTEHVADTSAIHALDVRMKIDECPACGKHLLTAVTSGAQACSDPDCENAHDMPWDRE